MIATYIELTCKQCTHKIKCKCSRYLVCSDYVYYLLCLGVYSPRHKNNIVVHLDTLQSLHSRTWSGLLTTTGHLMWLQCHRSSPPAHQVEGSDTGDDVTPRHTGAVLTCHRAVRVGPKLCQTGPKWDKYGPLQVRFKSNSPQQGLMQDF